MFDTFNFFSYFIFSRHYQFKVCQINAFYIEEQPEQTLLTCGNHVTRSLVYVVCSILNAWTCRQICYNPSLYYQYNYIQLNLIDRKCSVKDLCLHGFVIYEEFICIIHALSISKGIFCFITTLHVLRIGNVHLVKDCIFIYNYKRASNQNKYYEISNKQHFIILGHMLEPQNYTRLFFINCCFT